MSGISSAITGTFPHGPLKGSPVYSPPLSSGLLGGVVFSGTEEK